MRAKIVKQKKAVIVTNTLGSRSQKALADELSQRVGYKVLRVRPGRVGNRKVLFQYPAAKDKLQQFDAFALREVPTVEWTRSRQQAKDWCDGKTTVVVRHLINSSEGKGIELVDNAETMPVAKLYTKYMKKKYEYRIHVFNGRIIDRQEKRKRRGENLAEAKVRNMHNGYVFCRDNLNVPASVDAAAIQAVAALGYQFGAVDVVYNEKYDRPAVLEVNSRPGLMGTTLQIYTNAIMEG